MKSKFETAFDEMLNKLNSWFDTIIMNLPNLALGLIVFIISLFLARYIRKGMRRVLDRSSLQDSMKNLLARITAVAVVLLGLFLVLGILNLSKALNTVLAGAGVAGLAVGLALQGALANTYSGIVLSMIKQVKFGDWIKTNGYEGEVVDLNLRALTLKEIDNNLVYIPNKMVIENPIKNYSTTSQSRVILECGVAYNSDLNKVRDLVRETVVSHFDFIEGKEEVIFLYKEFGGSSINFEVRFWINSTSALELAKAKSEAMIQIKAAFDKEGIEIPFPIRTLNIPKDTLEELSGKSNAS
ncbi:small conductance mechanosensitive channel [Robiginitalea myxolifaciens]|uniref:Small conductance mechanosensitive channel n=1 Tax=Robiginitalea myxolifaciens TaxID=400055 RepID=A0A1I6FMZ3_9FLAO|nr:mechanosensitive ion channel [Robiginitalea myxolifaciens]SFR31323.1 small conductance mechanosensitive channel [Robiginitalea myxolifaciens]